MKLKNSFLIIPTAALTVLSSCSQNATTGQRAAGGALLGAGAGAIIGNQSGHAGEGAAIGAAVGGTAGYATAPQRRY
jgi:uncharacterized protein YcfJ